MSLINNENKMGPNTDPCGTPMNILCNLEISSPTWTDWNLSNKYSWMRFKAVFEKLKYIYITYEAINYDWHYWKPMKTQVILELCHAYYQYSA